MSLKKVKMKTNFANIGLLYQKHYFDGVRFDSDGNYKKDEAKTIKKKNELLLGSHDIFTKYFISSQGNSFELKSQYPGIVTGIGMKHETAIEGELKLGMYFDYTSGMPCIPASSVKGAIRAAFPQFGKHKNTPNPVKFAKAYIINQMLNQIKPEMFPAMTKKQDQLSHSDFEKIEWIEEEIFEGVNIAESTAEGNEKGKSCLPVYEKDIFHDAYIIKADDEGRILGDDAITHHPHPLKNPNPVLFLKLMPGITIQFNFRLKDGRYLKATEKKLLFESIITYYGIGAKTNVGYGQFEEVKKTKVGENIIGKLESVNYKVTPNRYYFKTEYGSVHTPYNKKLKHAEGGQKFKLEVKSLKENGAIKNISVKGLVE